nr:replication factor A protein 1-like [Ipomoea batatas]
MPKLCGDQRAAVIPEASQERKQLFKILHFLFSIFNIYAVSFGIYLSVSLFLFSSHWHLKPSRESDHNSNKTHTQSTGLFDFRSGSVVVSSISDMLVKQEDGDVYVPAEILGIEGSGRWYYISCLTPGWNKGLQQDENFLKALKFLDDGTTSHTVTRVLRDELLVSTYCQRLSDDQEKDLMSKMIEDDEEESQESDMVLP